ncbi:MAG TPA: hypothetical protein P5064_00580 [Clostridia bacterium]|jgi:hypothetical protein|nr:hypothetical protein [Clostridia bacterium]HRU58024.1 hypothetical protein [Clostridia bacterium]
MKYSIKKLYRAPIKTAIFILLIALSASALSISMGMWKYSYDSIKYSKDAFTTIGIVRELEFMEQIYTSSGEPKYDYELLGKVKQAAEDSQYTKHTDRRKYLMGYSPDITSFASDGTRERFYPYPYGIITGVCESIGFTRGSNYAAIFKIDKEDLNILPYFVERKDPNISNEYIYVRGLHLTNDLRFPFEVGEKYIVHVYFSGRDNDLKMYSGRLDYSGRYSEIVKYGEFYNLSEEEKKERPEIDRDRVSRAYEDTVHPFQKLTSSAQALLDSGDKRWNELVNNCRITKHSTEILLTDDMYSMYSFNTGDLYIVNGRAISKDEYEQGAKVCVISWNVAVTNDLRVGDKIKLSVYESDFSVFNRHIPIGDRGSSADYITEDIFAPLGYRGQDFITEAEYEIIGEYRGKGALDRGEFLISHNMIIVPSKSLEGDFNTKPIIAETVRSVDGKSQFVKKERTSIPGSFSVVIENGKTEEFEKEMEALGYGGMFYYFDQNYSEIAGKLDGYMKTASFILFISVLAWVCIVAVFLSIYMIDSRKNLATMLSLGAGRVRAFFSEMSGIVLIVIIASVIGLIAGMELYGDVLDKTIAASFEGMSAPIELFKAMNISKMQSTKAVWLSAIIQAVVLILIAAIIECTQSGQDVFRLMKGLKKSKNAKKN